MFHLQYIKQPNIILYVLDYSQKTCIFTKDVLQAKCYTSRDSAIIEQEQISFLFGLDTSIKKLEV